MTHPAPTSPWPTPPGVPPVPRTWCCELAQFGDECDCAAFQAELVAAFSGPVLMYSAGAWQATQ